MPKQTTTSKAVSNLISYAVMEGTSQVCIDYVLWRGPCREEGRCEVFSLDMNEL